MSMEEDKKEEGKKTVEIVLPGASAIDKVLGPVLGEVGEDLKRLYAVGRDMIFVAAYKKIEDVEDGKQANLRVTRDVLWNGSFSDSELCAEYFGGILASSRSEDGKDDDSIQFVDVTKSLSTKQLGLHYAIYNRLNKLLVASDERVNVAMDTELRRRQVWFSAMELQVNLELRVGTDLNILFRHGLLSQYESKAHIVGSRALPYVSANPTMFGILLYAAAHNRYDEWLEFDQTDFGDFEGIKLSQLYFDSLQGLVDGVGLTAEETS